jgi:ADP-ribosylation factor-binding protein GGA
MRAPTPTESSAPARANYSAFSSLGVSLPVQKTTPVQVSSSIAQPALVKPAEPVLDAFASLSNPLRQPVSQQNTSQPSSSASLLELAQIPLSTNASAADDEEWSFSSALPERNDLPSTYDLVIIDSSIHATLHVVRQSSSDPAITLVVKFSSRERQYINDLKFQVAVSKV